MRTLAVAALASLTALIVASSAGAAPATVSLFWEGTSGNSDIASSVGDTITLYIQVNSSAPEYVQGAGFRIDTSTAGSVSTFYDVGDGISSGGATIFPAASATYSGPGLSYISSLGCPVAATSPEATGNFMAGRCGDDFQLEVGLNTDLGGGIIGDWKHIGTGDITMPYTLAAVTFEVVPEPATGGLLALGLGALAFIGRRRA